jgi:serine/threonine protein phosphatase PrpC
VPAIVQAMSATARSDSWTDARINDDRLHVDADAGLAFVADASGPVYGGYWAPFAIDPGLAALIQTFGASTGTTRERLVGAVHAADAVMRKMAEQYEARRAERTGLEVARAVADAVRPAAWADWDSFAHFGGSVTACAAGEDAVVVAQVGECRAYGQGPGGPELLVRDHTLLSVLEACGERREVLEEVRQHGASALSVVVLLGVTKLQVNVVEVAAPITLALVTNGVWRCDGALDDLLCATTPEELRARVERCAKVSRDEATAVLLEIR